MAIALVNSISTFSSSEGTTIAPSALSITSGNLVVVCVYGYDTDGASPTVSQVTDTAGNTYTRASGYYRTPSFCQEIFYCYNATGNASNTVTATFSQSCLYKTIAVLQYSGALATSSVFDVGNNGTGTGTSMATTASTTNYANELMVAFFTINQIPTFTAGSGFTVRETFTMGASEDDTDIGAAGSHNAAMTSSVSGGWVGVHATFRQAATVPIPGFMASYRRRRS